MSVNYTPIGRIRLDAPTPVIEIDPAFRSGLSGLDGFGFIVVLWHADQAPVLSENDLVIEAPYIGAPEKLGLFATRSPARPNPVCVSTLALTGVDVEKGIVRLAWTDCEDKTPVLDIKPYHPSSDRIENPIVPDWCAHWPKSLEESGTFDWSTVFNF